MTTLQRAVHGIGVVIVRRTWLVAVVTVIACAAFSARAIAALLEASYLAPAPPAGVLPPPRVGPAPKTRTPPDGSPLVARNMFCSTCDPLPGGPGPTDSFVPDAILIATSIGDDPRATVRVPASEVQGSWGLGDTIAGLGKVTSIGWASIEIENASGRRGRLLLAGAATPPHEPPPAATTEWSDRVKKIDDHTFEVDRSLVRDLVGGAAKAGGVRVLPLTGEGGKLAGLRLFGITPTSLPGTMGLHNGDTLTTINNQKIESANTLLALYAQIDRLQYVELAGTRAGKPLAISLRLR